MIGSEGEQFFSNSIGCKYYAGNWANDEKNGIGKCYDKTGKLIYHGKYNNGRPTEQYPQAHDDSYKFEYIEYDNGDAYLGETYSGTINGLGILFKANGDAWYGEWKNGNRIGPGIELQYSGTVRTGNWKGEIFYFD
jgi:hypothetical protein